MDDYKKEPGGVERLKEKNPKWLNDLYVKFIRMSSHLIEKNGEGVLGFITNHGYLDNPTFRGMRWHLLKTFDKVYVLDLHGNAKKKEVTPEGLPDKNVFDIQQGVAIIVAVKRSNGSDDLAEVLHADLWGDRRSKYDTLTSLELKDSAFSASLPRQPGYLLPGKDYELLDAYNSYPALTEIFENYVLGFQTHRDKFAIADQQAQVLERVKDMMDGSLSNVAFHHKYGTKDNRDWKLGTERKHLQADKNWASAVTKCLYRPFDIRWCLLSYATMDYPRTEITKNVLGRDNLCLLASRQLAAPGYRHVLVTDLPAESCAVSLRTKEQNQVFPLYSFPDEQDLDRERKSNLDQAFVKSLRARVIDKERDELTPENIFDYLYAVLHCPAYRDKFAEFLKMDFPRIPWPKTPDDFWRLVPAGTALRRLHLVEPAAIGDTPYPFEGQGDGVLGKLSYEDGKVWVNSTQYFAGVPQIAWDFYIGGYQPGQRWLSERKGQPLGFDDIQHYQKIIKILTETDRIMRTIEMDID